MIRGATSRRRPATVAASTSHKLLFLVVLCYSRPQENVAQAFSCVTVTSSTKLSTFSQGTLCWMNSQNKDGKSFDSKLEEDEVYSLDEGSELRKGSISKSLQPRGVEDLERETLEGAGSSQVDYLDDLTPPPINWSRDSILFSENPATKRNNNAALDIWNWCQRSLPPPVTGVWPWREADRIAGDPLGAIYNMMVVRVPVLVVGLVYFKNLWESHPLIMDIGQGPFEVSPIVVFSVLAFILA